MRLFNQRKISLGLFISSAFFMAVSCAGPKTFTKIWYEVDPSTPSPQTKENITITIDYVEKSYQELLSYPMFWVPRESLPTEEGAWGALSNDVGGKLAYEFPGLTIFEVSLRNDTGHILRMNDARIYLVIGEETFPGLQKDQLMQAGALEDQNWRMEVKQGVINNRRIKVINDFTTEILPGTSFKGFVFFEMDPSLAEVGTLKFYDVTTEVDQAGNPTKKTTFEWKIIQKQAVVTAS